MQTYTITNMIGQTVKSGNLSNENIDVSTLLQGVYTIEFSSEKKTLSQKFIKR